MLPENHVFLIRGDDGQEYGPVDLRELRGWVLENRAGLGTEVRLDEPGAPWNPWQNYPELVALLAEAQVTNPASEQPGLAIAPIRRRIIALVADLLLLSILFIPIVNVLAAFMPMDVISQAAMNPWALQALPPETLHQLLVFQMISNGGLVLYMTGFLAAHGQTPGKALMRLRVVEESGRKPSLLNSFLRSVVLIFSIGLFFLPLVFAFFNPQRRTVHDLIAGTYVVEA
jgi:uncharacterized RDD family membrane protein YckC